MKKKRIGLQTVLLTMRAATFAQGLKDVYFIAIPFCKA